MLTGAVLRVSVFTAAFTVAFVSAQEPPKLPEPKKDAVKKDEPKAKDGEEVDVHKTAERIAENAQKAGDRLKEKDPGADTRKIQAEILKDIDALLKKAQEPPPPPMSSDMPPPKSDMPPPKDGMPPPKGGMSDMPPPKGGPGGGMKDMPPPKGSGSGGQGSQRPKRERKPRGDSPMGKGMNEPMPSPMPMGKDPMPVSKEPKGGNEKKDGKEGQGDQFGKTSPKRENDKMADLYKDVWGHLPDRLRQEMDLYYREQFMPRYSELLKQYYAALAEQQRRKSGEGK